MTDQWGIADGYHDVEGGWHPVPDATREALRAVMGDPRPAPPMWFVAAGSERDMWGPCTLLLEDGTTRGVVHRLPGDLPLGYHELVPVDGGPSTMLVVHPTRCPEPPRAWGVAAQIYSLWSDRSWGIGDLGDVAALARSLAAAGGQAILLSPVHAAAPCPPIESSPYFPSTRRAISPLLVPIDAPPPAALRPDPSTLIDRDLVWAEKRRVLEAQFRAEREDDTWRLWAHDQSDDLWSIARWNTIADDLGADWTQWPDGLRGPGCPALDERIAADPMVAERVEFHVWCQYRAHRALAEAADQGVTLIGDLAVGFSDQGADAWAFQEVVALAARVGAPPDAFNPAGQDWGLPPFVPWRLRAARYAPFIATLRAVFAHVGGLRIDHVMGLFRQYWIPVGADPTAGGYVEFPAEEMMALIALEASRAGAFVVGEDLGTVEPRVRESLARWGVLGTKVAWFDPHPPEEWPEMCLATITTHDLPTTAGLLTGANEELRERLAALVPADEDAPVDEVIARLHRRLLASPARLRLMTTDDLCAATAQPNVPGTVTEQNWSIRLPRPVDEVVPRVGLEPTPYGF